jgi:hypothetical protein
MQKDANPAARRWWAIYKRLIGSDGYTWRNANLAQVTRKLRKDEALITLQLQLQQADELLNFGWWSFGRILFSKIIVVIPSCLRDTLYVGVWFNKVTKAQGTAVLS